MKILGGDKKHNLPLCKYHPDGQSVSFGCSQLKKVIHINGNYNQIFCKDIPKELVTTVHNIYMFREELRKMWRKLVLMSHDEAPVHTIIVVLQLLLIQ